MKKITILQLYPNDMNMYGDSGNVLVLKKRLEWRGIEAKVIDYNLGDNFSELAKRADIIVGGGGQDSGQIKIHEDLRRIGPKIKELAENDTPMLVICGLYQLFGESFVPSDGETMGGIGLFNMTTVAKKSRLIGNIVIESEEFGKIVGYENHSGQTILGDGQEPLGQVVQGAGNDEKSGFEGARYKNVIGSYLHGSLLPKNPKLADFLITKAIENKWPDSEILDFNPPEFLNEITTKARNIAMRRPR